MAGRLNHARAKRQLRCFIATRGTAPQEDFGGDRIPQPASLRGWRLTDGMEHPVTVRRIGEPPPSDGDAR